MVTKPCSYLQELLDEGTLWKVKQLCRIETSDGGFAPAREVCRVSCNTCPSEKPSMSPSSPTVSPVTTLPTASPTKTQCTENPKDFFFFAMENENDITKKRCSFLYKFVKNGKLKQLKRICDREGRDGVESASIVCPITCGTCPTQAPSMAPSGPTVSPQPTDPPCIEKRQDEFFWKQKGKKKVKTKKCMFLQALARKNKTEQLETWCNKTRSNGEFGKPADVCPVTCGVCSR